MMTSLLVLNAVLAIASAAFGIAAVVRPAALVGSLGMTEAPPAPIRYFGQMYASRAIPLGAATAAVCVTSAFTDGGRVAGVLLVVAAVAQVGDVAIGVRHRIAGMCIGAGAAAVIHLATAMILVLG